MDSNAIELKRGTKLIEDSSWEDVEEDDSDTELVSTSHTSSSGASQPSIAPRVERRRPRTAIAVGSPRRRQVAPAPVRAPTPMRPPRQPPRVLFEPDEVHDALYKGTRSIARYVLDVLVRAIRWLRFFFSICLGVWLLAIVFKQLSHSIQTVMTPFCMLPFISSSMACTWIEEVGHHDSTPKWADYPKLVDVQSTSFEQLLDETVGGSSLALEIKKAEMATSDLVTLVRYSELTSKDALADALVDFVDEAKGTGRGLQKLGAKISGAVDSTLAVNDYALHAIEAASNDGGKSTSIFSLDVLWPFGTPSKDIVTKTFAEAMDVLSTSMGRVLIEAQVQLGNLDNLEQKLNTIHEILTREDSTITAAQAELLAELWTKLGGNRQKLRSKDQHLKLLRNLGDYRKRALAHVVAALQTLQGMSADMEELRERVAAPTLVGEKVSAEVHIRSIQTGLERLKNMRVKAKEREDEAIRKVLSMA